MEDLTDFYVEEDAVPLKPNSLDDKLHFSEELSDCNSGESDGESDDVRLESLDVSKLAFPDLPAADIRGGEVCVDNTSMRISDSQVQLGHKIRYGADVRVRKATTVVINNKQFQIACPKSHDQDPQDQSTGLANAKWRLIEKVQTFLRDRYRTGLTNTNPLPWCADFSLNLDEIYTTLQLTGSDRIAGKAGNQPVSLEQLLLHNTEDPSNSKCRVLIEGRPGYGKTTLTLRLASDWACGKPYLSKYSLVFRIHLRDFQAGDLKSYIFQELYPHEESEGHEVLWNYVKEVPEQILFILDGLDELPREKRAAIDVLLKGNLLDKANVIVTSRLVPSDDAVLSYFTKRIVIRGFSDAQIEQFINDYFRIRQNLPHASRLISFLCGPQSYGRSLAACPLTCLLLCVLFDDEGDRLLRKITDVYKELVNCLLRRATRGSSTAIPQQTHQKALRDFGRLCLELVSEDVLTFSAERLRQALKPNSVDLLLKLGLLMKVHSLPGRIQKDICYQSLHKTFMEYLAGYYLSWQVSRAQHGDLSANEKLGRQLSLLHMAKAESLHLVLKFTVGLLGESAAPLFRYLAAFTLPDFTLFELLHEAGQTPENIRALSSILDNDCVVVQSNRIELEGWAGLLADGECPVRCLKFQWVDSPLDNGALDLFFTALQANPSVVCLAVCASYGFVPQQSEMGAMASFTAQALKKSQLRHFSLDLAGEEWALAASEALSRALQYRAVAPSLSSLGLHINLGTEQLAAVCQGLTRCSHIKHLSLTKISCGRDGYQHLAKLIESGTSLQQLSISLNLFLRLPTPDSAAKNVPGSPEDLQNLMAYFYKSVGLQAGSQTASSGTQVLEQNCTPSSGKDQNNRKISTPRPVRSFSVESGLCQFGSVVSGALGILKTSSLEFCSSSEHHKSGFHVFFSALKANPPKLERLDLSDCFLNLQDLICLGDVLEHNDHLQSLRLANLPSFEYAMQILVRLKSNQTMNWLDLTSKRISLDDKAIHLLISALSSNTHLQSLSLAGWSFTSKDRQVMSSVNTYLKTSSIQELNLGGCKMNLSIPRALPGSVPLPTLLLPGLQCFDNERYQGKNTSRASSVSSLSSSSTSSSSSSPSMVYNRNNSENESPVSVISTDSKSCGVTVAGSSAKLGPWPNLVRLSLAKTTVTVQIEGEENHHTLQGPDLVTHLRGLRRLRELSINRKPQPYVPGTSGSSDLQDSVVMHDKASKRFFGLIQRRFGKSLEKLHCSSLAMHWYRPRQTSFWITNKLRQCEKLASIKLNLVTFKTMVHSTSNSQQSVHWLLEAVVLGLPHLSHLGIQGLDMTPLQAANFGHTLREKWRGCALQIETDKISDAAISALMHTLTQCSKLVVEYAGGTKDIISVQRRPLLCGLLRSWLSKSEAVTNHPANSEKDDKQSDVDDAIQQLRSTLPPGKWNAALTGASPLEESILSAHFWNFTFTAT